jgi:hypothetical protein
LTTRSSDTPSDSVMFSSERTFRIWRYGVGHSQLRLRAIPDNVEGTCLDLLFEGVRAMKLGTHYESIKIVIANADETREIHELANSIWAGQGFALALRSREGTGLVLCARASAWRGGTDHRWEPSASIAQNAVWQLNRTH